MLSRTAAAVALLAVAAALASPASAASPQATASKTCRVGDTRSYGTSYVLSISVRNTTCRAGRKVIRAFHQCRPGRAGRCNHTVLGYSCSEYRYDKIATQYSSKVKCTKGDRVVRHTYQQFT